MDNFQLCSILRTDEYFVLLERSVVTYIMKKKMDYSRSNEKFEKLHIFKEIFLRIGSVLPSKNNVRLKRCYFADNLKILKKLRFDSLK